MPNNVIRAIVLAIVGLTVSCNCEAQAQNQSVTLKRDALQQVEPFHARKQVQIIDESPIVTDLRRAPQQDVYNIEVGPGPAGQAPRVFSIKAGGPGSLPFAGTTSNIPAGGMRPVGNLPSTKMGVLPKYAPPRAIGSSAPSMPSVKTETSSHISAPLEYAKGPDRSILHGDGGGMSSAKPTVKATLLPRK